MFVLESAVLESFCPRMVANPGVQPTKGSRQLFFRTRTLTSAMTRTCWYSANRTRIHFGSKTTAAFFVSFDSGATWNDVTTEQEANFGFTVAVDPNDGNTAWVVPAESDQVRSAVDRKLCVCRTTDGGQTWERFSNGLPQDNCYDFAFRHGLIYDEHHLAFGTACGCLYIFEGSRRKTGLASIPICRQSIVSPRFN